MQNLPFYNWKPASAELKGGALIVRRPTEAESYIDSGVFFFPPESFLGALTGSHIKQKRLQLLTAGGLLFTKKCISWASLWKGGGNPFWHSAYKIISKKDICSLRQFHPLLLLWALLIFYSALLWLKSHFLKKTDDRQAEWLMILCHHFVFLRGLALRGWMLV